MIRITSTEMPRHPPLKKKKIHALYCQVVSSLPARSENPRILKAKPLEMLLLKKIHAVAKV